MRLIKYVFAILLALSSFGLTEAIAQDKLPTGENLHKALDSSKKELAPQELLTELRDTRLSLEQIKQQSINLFMEATRTLVGLNDKPLMENPRLLTASMVQSSKSYLPPRKDWMVFYVNTLEPILHLINEDMKDVEKNGLKVSEPLDKKLTPLWKLWRQDVVAINKIMDELQELIGPDKGTNASIARAALALYDRSTHLEKVRYQAVQICRAYFTAGH